MKTGDPTLASRTGGRRFRRRDESGAALVEFAFVALPLFFILYALIAFGMMLAVKQSITSAAADGARAAIGAQPIGAETLDQAQVRVARDRVDSALNWMGGKYVSATDLDVPTPTFCSGSSGPKCITVTITYPYDSRPIVPPAPGLGLVTPANFKAVAKVQVG